jgi:hypothetical protein
MESLESLLKRSTKVYGQIQAEQQKSNPDSSKLKQLEKQYEDIQDAIKKIAKG